MNVRWRRAALAVAGIVATSVHTARADERVDAQAPGPGERNLRLTAGGMLLHANDATEGSGERGGAVAAVGIRLAGSLEVEARYEMQMGEWTYLSSRPALAGGAPARATAFEHYHRGDLSARYAFAFGPQRRMHVAPRVGIAYLSLASDAYASAGPAAGGGLELRFDLSSLSWIESGATAVRVLSPGGGDTSLLGAVQGVWIWNAGVALGATRWSRVHMAYLGEALDRDRTTRWSHGLMLSLDVEVFE